MKTKLFFISLLMIVSGQVTVAQEKADSAAIEKACRDYVEGWATGDAGRVLQAVSPELVKRTVGKDKAGNSYTNNMSASLLAAVSGMNREGVKGRDFEPDKPFRLEVKICDITGDFAMAKTLNTKYGFFDYCQLAKYNGEWKIMNVLWGMLPERK